MQFTDEERMVFAYTTPSRAVKADPQAVYVGLTRALGGNPQAVLDAASSENLPAAIDAEEQMVAAARQTFGMDPFDPETGAGATGAMCLRVLDEFLLFCNGEKKNTAS